MSLRNCRHLGADLCPFTFWGLEMEKDRKIVMIDDYTINRRK